MNRNKFDEIIKKTLMFLIAVNMFFLSACFPTGENKRGVEDTENSLKVTDGKLEMNLIDNLKIDTNVNIPVNVKWKSYEAELRTFTEIELKENFINKKNKNIIDKFESTSGFSNDYKALHFEFSDNTGLSVDKGSFLYTHPQLFNKSYFDVIFKGNEYVRSDLSEIYTKDSLASLSKESSVEEVKDIIESLGISVIDTPEVYVLDYQTLMSEWEDYLLPNGNAATAWSQEDEAYFILFKQIIDTSPISEISYVDNGNQVFVPPGNSYAVVTRNGIICLSLSGIYSVNSKLEENQIISIDNAIEAVKSKYSDIILTDLITITNITAELIPISTNANTFNLVPVWIFKLKQSRTITDDIKKDNRIIESKFYVIVDAVSGVELRLGG